MPKLGDPIFLALELFNGDTSKHPRAHLYDASGSELGASPVSLTHLANGLYVDSSVNMPNTAQVKAVYKVYDDAGHTTLSADYGRDLDTFDLITDPAPSVTVVTLPEFIIGLIEATELTGIIVNTSDDLSGIISEC